MDIDAKLRSLYLLQILQERTDDVHPRKEVELRCDNGTMDALIVWFGPDVKEQYRQMVENAAKDL